MDPLGCFSRVVAHRWNDWQLVFTNGAFKGNYSRKSSVDIIFLSRDTGNSKTIICWHCGDFHLQIRALHLLSICVKLVVVLTSIGSQNDSMPPEEPFAQAKTQKKSTIQWLTRQVSIPILFPNGKSLQREIPAKVLCSISMLLAKSKYLQRYSFRKENPCTGKKILQRKTCPLNKKTLTKDYNISKLYNM